MVDLIDTNGVKPTLKKGVLGYDDYSLGGDAGRLYVGTGTDSIAQAKKSEVDAKVSKVTSTDNAIVRFDGTTGAVQNSGVVIDDSNNVGMNNSIGNTFTAYGIGGVNKGYVGDGNWMFGGSTNDFGIRATNNLVFGIGAIERMRINSSGHVGIGVTPSAWKSTRIVLEFPTSSISDNGAMSISVSANSYENSSSQSIYKSNGYATANYQNAGCHYWLTAPSGTAGNAITWTNAMTLDASGNLLLTSGTGVLGYAFGAGGMVTQLTSKSTTVTLNKPSGTIYTHNESLAAGASVSFPFGNNLLDGYNFGDTLVVNGAFTPTTLNPDGLYRIEASMVGSGGARIRITNLTGAARAEVIAINFSIVKGARV